MRENVFSGRSEVEVGPSLRAVDTQPLDFSNIYNEHFAFVWRSARAFGVSPSAIDDVVQEVFIVVHKKLVHFEKRSSVRTWLTGILINAVRDYRRTLRRKGGHESLCEELVDTSSDPSAHVETTAAVSTLLSFLSTLSEEQRNVFVLAELEQMRAPEIAEALSVNLSTVYSRLRLAREAFEREVNRMQLRERRMSR